MRFAAILLPLALVHGPAAGHACSQDRLSELVGAWQSRGFVVPGEDSAPQALRCALTLSMGDQALVSRGLCATAAERQEVFGKLACQNGSFVGTPFGLVDGLAEVRLRRDISTPTSILLEYEVISTETERAEQVLLRLEPASGGRWRLIVSRGIVNVVSLDMIRQ